MPTLFNVTSLAAFKRKRRDMEKRKKVKSRQAQDEAQAKTYKLIKRSVNFPQYVWDALAKEARRQKRTLTAQLEFIVCEYFHLVDDVDESLPATQHASKNDKKIAA